MHGGVFQTIYYAAEESKNKTAKIQRRNRLTRKLATIEKDEHEEYLNVAERVEILSFGNFLDTVRILCTLRC